MKNKWSEKDVRALVSDYAGRGIALDMALRVYSARLLGSEPSLVLHGGGNVSLKSIRKDVTGEDIDTLLVKGSGHDMANIDVPGFAAVRLAPLIRLKNRRSLDEAEMRDVQRCFLLQSTDPVPSVELLGHAFLPQPYVDHTHSDAVLALTNQCNGDDIAAELFAGRGGIVPYVMPGLRLAKKMIKVYQSDTSVQALILVGHGIFTFGDSAEESYQRMIHMVSLAERRLKQGRRKIFATAKIPFETASHADIAPVLRGLVAAKGKHMVFEFRGNARVMDYVNCSRLSDYSKAGVVTPDHVIRVKPWPLVLPSPERMKIKSFRREAEKALKKYIDRYQTRFARYCDGNVSDPLPRVMLVPGLGLFGAGENARAAMIAADIAEANIRVISAAEAIGGYRGAREKEMFAFEQWGPERAKLGADAEKPLSGHIVAVTGGGGTIGSAIARAFAKLGAEVALLDINHQAAITAAGNISASALALSCDITNRVSVASAFKKVVQTFGGLDISVSNAGAARQGAIADIDDKILRQSFDLNFFAHQTVAKTAAGIISAQGTGGCLLFNVSKQAVNPGANFGAYGLPKSALMFLVRQYALELGGKGIRTGGVNADRIRSGLLTKKMISSRAGARGLSEKDYMAGNLLGREVTADDVAQAFVYMAMAEKSTADILTVDGGNIAAALR